MMVKFAVV